MLLFKDIKQNYPVYIFNKQELTVTQGKVISVSFPRYDNASATQLKPMATPNMVVDVVIEANGSTATYTIPEGLAITYANNLVLSTEKEGLVNEITALRSTAEQILASVNKQKEIVEKSTSLLEDLDPVSKERRENDQRMTNLEKSVGNMQKMMQELLQKIK